MVNEGGGTGGRRGCRTSKFAAKDRVGAGGVQRIGEGHQRRRHSKDLRDNGWFEGFAPRSAPEIVVVALWEHGVHGWLAAPIVKDVMAAYFDKKKRLSQFQQLESARCLQVGSDEQPGTAGTANTRAGGWRCEQAGLPCCGCRNSERRQLRPRQDAPRVPGDKIGAPAPQLAMRHLSSAISTGRCC